MTFQQELKSWMNPTAVPTSEVPEVGSKAPSTSKLQLPNPNGNPTIITFLRHCGCPFAEKTFKQIRETATKYPSINFAALSHSTEDSTEKWLESVGGPGMVEIIVDTDREIYAKYGLGVSSAWHVLNPWSMYSVYKLGKTEEIWNKPTESGTRWQTSGSFAVDRNGVVKWAQVAKAADDIPDFENALKNLSA